MNEDSNILITGATGNVGREVISFLSRMDQPFGIRVASRAPDRDKKILAEFDNLEYVLFDFNSPDTFSGALEDVDYLFLMRPPQISAVGVFKPLIERCSSSKIKIIFLSVQGVERSKVIPHHKIEELIRDSGVEYIFVRPGYFMQNLTTTLHQDIREKRKIILPAGKAVFNWIDVRNIGESIACFFRDFDLYKNKPYEITGYENEDFYFAAHLISKVTGQNVDYRSVGPIRFYLYKKKQGMPAAFILVMIMLHYLPRFQKPPIISRVYKSLTGKPPTTLEQFIERERNMF